ncbi:MAG: peptidoglycan editing factor PgeF [Termitinemataceae bacterium]|nr:MAG: peptidoglycan editing factor PgeF [Termitinemataceae bacterium]
MIKLYDFNLNFDGDDKSSVQANNLALAKFNFIFDGKKIDAPSCAITSVKLGNMNYDFPDTNTARLNVFDRLNIRSYTVFSCKQNHSRNVVVIRPQTLPYYVEADGLITDSKTLSLAVTVADCLPVYLFDTGSGAFSVLHSGWKGTGIVHNALQQLKNKFAAKPKNVAAILGPCIQSCCYEVDKERADQFNEEFGNSQLKRQIEKKYYPLGSVVKIRNDNDTQKYFIDMQAANAHLLVKDGVQNIAYCKDCTFMNTNLGSYRREGAGFTKMMALIGHL